MANIQKRGSRCLPRQQHMWDEGRPLSFCQPHPLPRQHSIDTLRPQIEQNSCRDPHPACAAGVAHACTRAQFHGDPRVKLVSISHPETSNQAEFMPRPSCCMCCWRGARVHAFFLTKSNTEHLKNGGQEEKSKQFIVATMQERGREMSV